MLHRCHQAVQALYLWQQGLALEKSVVFHQRKLLLACRFRLDTHLGAAELQAEEQRTCSELHEAGNPEIRGKAEFVEVAGVKRGRWREEDCPVARGQNATGRWKFLYQTPCRHLRTSRWRRCKKSLP